MRSILTLIVLFIHIYNKGLGQIINVYNADNGLAQGFISAIIQDKDGYIWAGTYNGLSRFDGTRFKTFRTVSGSNTALRSNKIYKLLQSANGHLWVFTEGNIQLYDKYSSSFLVPDYFQKNKLGGFRDAAFDRQNRMWILTTDKLLCFEVQDVGKKGELKKTKDLPFETSGIKHPTRLAIGDTAVWIATNDQLWTYNRHSGTLQKAPVAVPGPICQLWQDQKHGGVWIQTTEGAGIWQNKPIRWFPEVRSRSNLLYTGLYTGQETVLIGANGIFEWDGKRMNLQLDTLPFEIISACTDHQGNLWLGTNAQGLYQLDFHQKPISAFWKDRFISEAVFKDKNGTVRSKVEKKCGNATILENQKANTDLSIRQMLKLAVDEKGETWYLQCDNTITNQTESAFCQIKNISAGERVNLMRCLSGGHIALVKNNGILLLEPMTGKEILLPNSDIKGLRFPDILRVSSIKTDQAGIIWMGLDDGLLQIRADWRRGTLEAQLYPRSVHLPDLEILSVETGSEPSKAIWLGTLNGFYKFFPDTRQVSQITTNEIGRDETVYCMQKDRQGQLWLGTNIGLKMYNPSANVSTWFTVADGLPASEFNRNTEFMSADGEIFMGTVAGAVRFYPTALAIHSAPEKIVISEAIINDTLSYVFNPEKPYILSCAEGDLLKFHFSLLDFFAAGNRKYKYRMVGLSNEWTTGSPDAAVTFARLPAGKYEFEVCASNGRGVWSQPARMEINVAYPLRKKVGLLVLTLLIGAALVYGWQLRKRSFIKQQSDTLPEIGTAIPLEASLESPSLSETDTAIQQSFFRDLMLQLIESHFRDSNFNVKHIQEKLNISKTQLHRKMVAETGNTVAYFLKKRRLEEAVCLLKTHPEMTISEIAYASGFSDPNYFSTAFSTNFGQSPKKYRENLDKSDV